MVPNSASRSLTKPKPFRGTPMCFLELPPVGKHIVLQFASAEASCLSFRQLEWWGVRKLQPRATFRAACSACSCERRDDRTTSKSLLICRPVDGATKLSRNPNLISTESTKNHVMSVKPTPPRHSRTNAQRLTFCLLLA